MGVKIDFIKSPDHNFFDGLATLGGKGINEKTFDLVKIGTDNTVSETEVRLRAKPFDQTYTGDITRIYTRLKFSEIMKKIGGLDYFIIYGEVDKTPEKMWLAFCTEILRDYRINLITENGYVEQRDEDYFVVMNNKAYYGEVAIKFVDAPRVKLSETIPTRIENLNWAYGKNDNKIDNTIDGETLLKKDLTEHFSKLGIELHLDEVKFDNDTNDSSVVVEVGFNNPYYVKERYRLYYTKMNIKTRIELISNGTNYFYYPKTPDEVKSEDYPDIVRAFNEQYNCNLLPEDLSSISSGGSFIFRNQNYQFLYYQMGMTWRPELTQLNDVYPNERLDMFEE